DLQDAARGLEVERDVDDVVPDGGGVVRRSRDSRRRERPHRRGRRRGQRGREAEHPGEKGRAPHRTIASNARSVSEKSWKSASGFSAASVSGLVIPVATATARTPSARPQATSWIESPTMTTDFPSKRRPVCANARSTAIGGSSYRSAESLPKAPNGK